jgi:flagellar hook-associated protein 2
MAAIQISGLLSNQAFDWKTVVSELIAADSIPITNLQAEETTNTNQITALGSLQTDMTGLQTAVENLQTGDLFAARTVTSSNSNSTWKSTSADGAALGTYNFSIQTLATQAQTVGAVGVSSGLNASSNVSGLTLANMNVATPITAGTFTVNGQQVTVSTTESLQDVFNSISTATGGDVTGSYAPSPADGITLTSASGAQVLLGADNDTSNFLSVMKLSNNDSSSVSSSAPLGTVELSSPIASSDLSLPLTGLDSSGNGTLTINGVAINYNVNTDTVSTLLSRINNSTAGVTVSYDSANNRFDVTNNNTGDVGMALSDTSGNLLAAMGLTSAGGGSFVHGKNAQFTINGGPTLTSLSNSLDSSVTGISGFSVTVNSETAETLQIQSDTASMQTAIQAVITAYNQLQSDITTDTKITSSGGTTTASVLSSNNEVTDWATNLQSMAFDAVTGVTGSIQSLNDLGIGFADTTGQLSITNSTTLANALTDSPQDVQNFFLTGSTGFVSRMYTGLTNDLGENSNAQGALSQNNTDLGDQITAMQTQLNTEQTDLTNEFITMLDAQSTAQSESTTLTNAFMNPNNSSSSCWVARAVYGAGNPRWLVFRFWLLKVSPAWFRWLYLRHGERFASWLDDKPRLRHVIRYWMDSRVERVLHP